MGDQTNSRVVVDLSIDDILPNRYQPRIKFDDNAIFELSESIKNHGVFHPILVRPIGDKYEIIAGERRYKASVLAGRKTIPALIMSLNDKDTVEIALLENVQRAELTPIEEAISYKKILDMGYIKQEELARKLGKNQSTIANKLRLLNLDEDVQEALLKNKISERHARSLLKLKDKDDQKIMLKRIINERLTVRKTDEEIDKMIDNKDNEIVNPVIINDTLEEPTLAEQEIIPEVKDEVVTPNQTEVFGFTNDDLNFSNFNNANNSTVMSATPQEKVENILVEQTNVDEIEKVAAPVYDEKPVANMDDLLKVEQVDEPKEEVMEDIQIESEPTFTGKFFNMFTPEPASVEEAPKEETFEFNNFVEAKPPVQDSIDAPSFDDFFKNQPTVTLNDDDDLIPLPKNDIYENEIPATMPETVNTNNSFVSVPGSKNIMEAVNVIREATSKLEALGYSVDVDEIDLESFYQLIIKIDK